MGRLGRDVYRRKLERHLSQSIDEPMINLVSAVVAAQAGNASALQAVADLPPEALGAKLGSPYHIPLWMLETLVNELLATPKAKGLGVARTRLLRTDSFGTLRALQSILINLENAEDGIFLERHDVFYEMARIAQRQFPWQRGVANGPHIYRSVLLYGSGSAKEFFEADLGISVADFIKTGVCMYGGLARADFVPRQRDLSQVNISPEVREAALARICVDLAEARRLAASMRRHKRHTGYSPSLMRDYPIIAFGEGGQRLRSPIPELIMYRYTSGLYLDVVKGGPSVWTEIGKRFEGYVLEYLQAMMDEHTVTPEIEYGPKKSRYRTPDILVSKGTAVVAVVECKAKRMSFDARYADDPVAAASVGFEELAKGIFQIWRFFAHARKAVAGAPVLAANCQGIIATADSWLAMASNQAEDVIANAHALADAEGGIEPEDRREIAFCQIEDIEFALQTGDGDSFLTACREIASGPKKGFMLSVAHAASKGLERPFPFRDRMHELLPWIEDPTK